MTIALDLAEGRIAIVQAVERLEKAEQADYQQLRGELREVQRDIISGLGQMRRTVTANATIAEGTESYMDRRFNELEKKLEEAVRKVLANGSSHG